MHMPKISLVRCVILSLMAICWIPAAHAQTAPNIFEPDRGRLEIGIGYQYQHYNVLGQTFHDNGFNVDISDHVVDWITGAGFRLAVSAEGAAVMGFGNTAGTPSLVAKSLFLGAGPHVSIESAGRVEPWLHVLPGWQHFRFTQTATIGSNSAFGFMAGGGVDIRIAPTVYWRVQTDYIGTHFQSALQSNYSFGSGLVLYF